MQLIVSDLSSERGSRLIFEGVSFSLGDGDLFTVTGPNGAGKSTLLRIIAGLLPAISGTISVDPEVSVARGTLMHYLGHREGLKSALTVHENLTFWRRTGGEAGLPILDALDMVELGHVVDTPAAYLSAGQKRRVAIARLLTVQRPIWLLDEPTSALDAQSEVRLGEIIGEHVGSGGMVLAATHLTMPVAATGTLDMGHDQ